MTSIIICYNKVTLNDLNSSRYSNDREERNIVATWCQTPLWGERKIHSFGWTNLFSTLAVCCWGAWCSETKRGRDGVAVIAFALDNLGYLVLPWGIKLNWSTKDFCKAILFVWWKVSFEGAIIFCSSHNQFFHTITLHWNPNIWNNKQPYTTLSQITQMGYNFLFVVKDWYVLASFIPNSIL